MDLSKYAKFANTIYYQLYAGEHTVEDGKISNEQITIISDDYAYTIIIGNNYHHFGSAKINIFEWLSQLALPDIDKKFIQDLDCNYNSPMLYKHEYLVILYRLVYVDIYEAASVQYNSENNNTYPDVKILYLGDNVLPYVKLHTMFPNLQTIISTNSDYHNNRYKIVHASGAEAILDELHLLYRKRTKSAAM